ncbi:MAG: hypothetical protein AAGI23_13210 [Bacteroidota bacterium]
MYIFILFIEEPYPAIYQPSFGATVDNLDTVNAKFTTITAFDETGGTHDLAYKDVFLFSPKNWDVRTFHMLLNSQKEYNTKIQLPITTYERMKYIIFKKHPIQLRQKRRKELDPLKTYIKKRVNQLTGQSIQTIHFKLYDRSYVIATKEQYEELAQEIKLEL